jgi:cephalosporin hydroxylase
MDNKPAERHGYGISQATTKPQYSYNFHRQDRPTHEDIMVMVNWIWEVKPTRIIETGIAHGGSLTFSTRQCWPFRYVCDANENGKR